MPPLNRRSVLFAVGLGLVLVAASAGAERPWRLPRPVPSYSVTLEDASGAPLPTFHHEGRTFVLGERGERYAIRVHNPTAERVEAVISVDGRDAVSGDVADYRSQRGYIVPPYGSIRIEGFRRSLDEVATFRFSSPHESYSARRGTPENVGVIGVAVFRERSRPIVRRDPPRPFPRRVDPEIDASEAPSASAPESRRKSAFGSARSSDAARRAPSAEYVPRDRVNNLGTEYGETRESSVVEVSFVRRSASPDRLFTLRYDDAAGLESRGVDLGRWFERRRYAEPQPFPRSRFAPPPP